MRLAISTILLLILLVVLYMVGIIHPSTKYGNDVRCISFPAKITEFREVHPLALGLSLYEPVYQGQCEHAVNAKTGEPVTIPTSPSGVSGQ